MKRLAAAVLLATVAAFGQSPRDVVMEAWEAVSQNYVEIANHRAEWNAERGRLAGMQVESAEDAHRVIREMVGRLGNSRLQWLSAEDVKAIVPEFSGAPAKLGLAFLSFEFLPGKKKVIAPLAGSPAALAGVHTGDVLVSVNGTVVEGMSAGEVVRLLDGAGTKKASLRIVRDGVTKKVDINPAEYRFVSWSEKNGKFDVVVREFTVQAGKEFDEALKEMRSKPEVKSVTIDLRNNPGGLLEGMRDVAAAFISDKEFMCRKDAAGKTECQKTKAGVVVKAPVTVLVNEGTASAAEIFAAGFQRTGRGKVAGCRTYGHGFGGQLKTLSDGSVMLIPDTSYLDADGRKIEGRGVVPDEAQGCREQRSRSLAD